jgi:hypothetical protein
LKLQEVNPDETGMSESDFYSDPLLEKIHPCRRLVFSLKDIGLVLPPFSDEFVTQNFVELKT